MLRLFYFYCVFRTPEPDEVVFVEEAVVVVCNYSFSCLGIIPFDFYLYRVAETLLLLYEVDVYLTKLEEELFELLRIF